MVGQPLIVKTNPLLPALGLIVLVPLAPAGDEITHFDLRKRKQEHWCWQPLKLIAPPSAGSPTGSPRGDPGNPIDAFLVARLEENHLKPAPPAEKRTLLRRLYFDLIGLPPRPEEVEQFLGDSSRDAYERVVDHLLSSPRFGERWARHWLDLVRYSETLGHEFDYLNQNAWRYRDYVIRAFNADVPYDQFVTEHLAGDLLERPRCHPTEGFNESIIGTAFYWLGQRDHSPVDVRLHQAEVIDNQIDVLSKTFLGLTVACARCHDHKFDAIGTKDYYALYGILGSSRYAQRSIEPPERIAPIVEKLRALKEQIREALGRSWSNEARQAHRYLPAARAVIEDAPPLDGQDQPPATRRPTEAVARDCGLDPRRLERWVSALEEDRRKARRSQAAPANLRSKEVEFADFGKHGFDDWFVEGDAFGAAPGVPGDFRVGDSNKPVAGLLREPMAHSGALAGRLQGVLRSPTFTIRHRYIHLLAAGREARVNVPVDNFTMIRDPIYGGLKKVLNHDEPRWITIEVNLWKGHRAYLEFSDVSTPDPADDGHKDGFAPNGWIAVGRVLFSDLPDAPAAAEAWPALAFSESSTEDWVAAWRARKADPPVVARLDWLLQRGLLEADASNPAAQRVSALVGEFQHLEAALPEPARVPSLVDGSGLDETVFIRGNHKTPGEIVPRRFLEALGGSAQAAFREGSGRLALARAVTDPANPLLARVLVNRVWLHLFGRGIAPSPDDFGALGQAPTHPELLDWLAHWFRTEGGWQPKKLIKLLVTSHAYRMSSQPGDPVAEEKDPGNLLWHRMEVRRLEGEIIRDAILALSGRLDLAMFGPPVPIHLTEFMDGRGRPANSGPLDGAGRRTIYVEVRRNFVSPMMRAFDTPVPHSTVGRRTVSNVPAQSLILMNDPFVIEQAQRWAKDLLAGKDRRPDERVRAVFLAAFGRPPSSQEQAAARSFLEEQGASYGVAAPDRLDNEKVWADFCHVLLNVKEFVFVN